MLKRVFSILGQSVAMFVAAFAGMLFLRRLAPSLHVVHVLSQDGFLRRQYEFDWMIAVFCVYVLFLAIGLGFRRIRTSWITSTAALVLTVVVLVVFTKIGFKDVNLLYGPN